MNFFDLLSLVGGLCLFLFGMNMMGAYLEKSAGAGLKNLLGKLTTGKAAGFFTGVGVTAIIHSSATTIMVVGFVNSGLMTLRQAINVIMGSNVGTTLTTWLTALSGVEGDSLITQILKPTTFTPFLALAGIILYMFCKKNKQKDIGVVLLGFSTLMFGMNAMSGAVSGLKGDPEFINILTMFNNPFLGVLTGAVITAVIQSSGASVGVLQALSSTGAINIGMSIPIIMGQNIGTCVTALISSVGTNRNARRASMVHLSFNIIGTVFMLIVYMIIRSVFNISLFSENANHISIAAVHTIFNVVCTLLLLPFTALLEKLAMVLIPEPKSGASDIKAELDDRLMATPAIAIERCRAITIKMAEATREALTLALEDIENYSIENSQTIRDLESEADHYEDILGSYLVRLGTHPLSDADRAMSARLLHLIGDFERISDHAVNIVESVEELEEKQINFSADADKELKVLIKAVREIVNKTFDSFVRNDYQLAGDVEPLEQVIDDLKDKLKKGHILRLQKGDCTIEVGFVWSDLLGNMERISDHCSNIAGLVTPENGFGMHEYLGNIRATNEEFQEKYKKYSKIYAID